MAKVKIVYGTGGGNTEMVCEKVAGVLELNGLEVEMLKAKLTDPAKIGEFDLLIFASPTYGHGQLELYFEKFLAAAEAVDFKDKPCTVIGLGDPKYDRDYHLESIKIISDFFKKKGAKMIGLPLRVSKYPISSLDNYVQRWAEKLVEILK
ncbi:MAG: flavodoxin family protein [Patescibacteria group bacterium]